MGFFSEVDIDIQDMIEEGASWREVKEAYPMLRDDEIDQYFAGDHDGDDMDGDPVSALASAGWGTDEDYGFYGEDY